ARRHVRRVRRAHLGPLARVPSEVPEKYDHEQPSAPDRHRQPTRVLEALLRERHHARPEEERVRRVQPPQLSPVFLEETADALAMRAQAREASRARARFPRGCVRTLTALRAQLVHLDALLTPLLEPTRIE